MRRSNLQIIKDSEGNIHPILVILAIILLLPLFLYEGYLLMDTAENVEVDDIYMEEYRTEIDEESGVITEIGMDVNIDIKNSGGRDLHIDTLEYDLMIEPDDEEGEDIVFDRGELTDKTVQGSSITTLTLPVENENEDEIDDIQTYILEKEGRIDAVVEVHVPIFQIYLNYPVTTVSEAFMDIFEYRPILADYIVYEQQARLKEGGEADHVLEIPYEIDTNENDFVSGEVDIETNLEGDAGEVSSRDHIELSIGDHKEGNFSFGLYEEETEEILTESQTIEFYSNIGFEEDISFQLDHPDIESPAMLEELEVDEDNARLEEDGEDDEYVLKTPYTIKTNEIDFVSGEVDIKTTMTDDDTIHSSDEISVEIGDEEDGNLNFGLEEDDIEELLTETQTIEFSSEITTTEEDISFERDHETVESQAMLVEYVLDEEAELNREERHLEIQYNIETQETAFFDEGGTISINTTMESKDESITSSDSFEIEIGEREEGILEFELEDDEIDELENESKTFTFTSDVERDEISFEHEHDETVEWDPENIENEVSGTSWYREKPNLLKVEQEEKRTRNQFYISSESSMVELG